VTSLNSAPGCSPILFSAFFLIAPVSLLFLTWAALTAVPLNVSPPLNGFSLVFLIFRRVKIFEKCLSLKRFFFFSVERSVKPSFFFSPDFYVFFLDDKVLLRIFCILAENVLPFNSFPFVSPSFFSPPLNWQKFIMAPPVDSFAVLPPLPPTV